MNFQTLKKAFQQRFTQLSTRPLFVVDVPADKLWETYLNAYPADTPIFRSRKDHDCSCCRHFIRDLGNVVALNPDGTYATVWGFPVPGEPTYQKIAFDMNELLMQYPIRDAFLTESPKLGTDVNRATIDGVVHAFNHFHVNNIPAKAIAARRDIPTRLGVMRTNKEMVEKALTLITDDAVSEVLEMIASNSLYRGEEHKAAVIGLRDLKAKFKAAPCTLNAFAWLNLDSTVARIKNTVIGTLLEDLSEGKDLEYAVKSFEQKVAPMNYKRPTALVTPKMIEKAREEVASLGLLDALHRRYATLADISVNDVLFADRTAKPRMKDVDAFSALAANMPINPKTFDRVDEVPVDTFLNDVLPTAKTLEVLFENKQVGNLVSLVTEAVPGSARLFKWDNPFSWSYNGDLADSEMRRAVQERGGRVDGVFRFTHSWNHPGSRNASLMDLHVFLPKSTISRADGVNDHYGNQERVGWNHRKHQGTQGVQDVDYVQLAPVDYIPVENITFPDIKRMPDGEYVCKVHNWSLRGPTQGGFKAEIEFDGQIFEYSVERPLKNKEWMTVAVVTKKGEGFTIEHKLPASSMSRNEWGIETGQFHRVNAVLQSPNHWVGEKGIGNRHTFFLLANCVNAGNARGFYNEFLRGELEPHRKVLEMIGSRQRTDETPDQLSGLGFSSTKKETVIVRVTGTVSRVLKVTF